MTGKSPVQIVYAVLRMYFDRCSSASETQSRIKYQVYAYTILGHAAMPSSALIISLATKYLLILNVRFLLPCTDEYSVVRELPQAPLQ